MPLHVPVLGDTHRRLVVVGYDEDKAKGDIHAAIDAFLALGETARKSAALPIFEYYQDVQTVVGSENLLSIAGPDDVWPHIEPHDEVLVQRGGHRDRQVYISVECECTWEPEHGLQIVFRGGRSVTKIGPYDGHLTNAAAYGRDDLEGVVYHRIG